MPYARDAGRLLIAYSPLGRGQLSGRYAPNDPLPGDLRRRNPLFRPPSLRRAAPLLGALREVAATHAATPAQVALAWLVGQGPVVAIPGARTLAQLEENVAAGDLILTSDELARLTEAAARFEAGARG